MIIQLLKACFQMYRYPVNKCRCLANEHKSFIVNWDIKINVQYIHVQYVPVGVHEYMIVLSHNYHDMNMYIQCTCSCTLYVHTSTIYVQSMYIVQLSGTFTSLFTCTNINCCINLVKITMYIQVIIASFIITFSNNCLRLSLVMVSTRRSCSTLQSRAVFSTTRNSSVKARKISGLSR